MSETTVGPEPVLQQVDRCDRCHTAQALVLVKLGGNGGYLYFCRHDWALSCATVLERGGQVIDSRDMH